MAQKIKTIIVDDEQDCIDILRLTLHKHCPWIEIIGEYSLATEAVKMINELAPQLVFMDIVMPHLNGFEVMESLTSKTVEVIFTTAHDAYAVKAFKANAMDYLLKPLTPTDVTHAARKALDRIGDKVPSAMGLENLLQAFKMQGMYINKLALPDTKGLSLVSLEDIIYLEADSNYTHVHVKGGKKITVSKSLKEFETQLNMPNFLRVHKGYIANLNHALKYHKGSGGYLDMSNGKSIEVSRQKRQELMDLLKLS